MRYLIIGLGIYGSNLALDLTDMGHEVVGADRNPANVEAIKDNISTAYTIDSTDETALGVLPLKNVDLVIVAIGEDFGASIRTVALLKKMGVPRIYARAIDSLHESILESFEIERILKPEQEAAQNLAHELELGCDVNVMQVDASTIILKFKAPEYFVGMNYSRLMLAEDYNLVLIAATRKIMKKNILGLQQPTARTIDITAPEEEVRSGDIFICYGTEKAYRKLYQHI